MPDELAHRVATRYPDVLTARGETTVILDRGLLLDALVWLRDEPDLGFDSLSCLTATDWPEQQLRFWVAYELYSLTHRHRLRVKVGVAENDARVPTVTFLFPTANWHERETYDFFGIVFVGHPALERILMPEGWEGHPLRKDYGLGGVNTQYTDGKFIPPIDERLGW
ncbi:MAG: NADH-quinone oxidoreductase subunit C [Actinomycetota bacterium]